MRGHVTCDADLAFKLGGEVGERLVEEHMKFLEQLADELQAQRLARHAAGHVALVRVLRGGAGGSHGP